ncbi:MAG: 50S ribosomal protein L33 [Fibrobacter sp.]|jgi:large subunit ribosomal protein L33|nr:50S ribosomal protein L33 [Fibrobacter sp.]MDY6370561.1 50S ribosomal protein L33 [Fibrobacter sp.]MDY6389120.1 50S ribosomal protein L33 [Fibrobacter sp.]
MARELITLECTVCHQRNYDCDKNKKLHPSRVEYKKYCPFCRKHTVHKETK